MGSSPPLTYQGKLVRDPSIRWQLGSKAQSGKHFITVVVLDDFTYRLQSHGISVQLVGAHVVEGGGLGRVTWTECGSLLNYCRQLINRGTYCRCAAEISDLKPFEVLRLWMWNINSVQMEFSPPGWSPELDFTFFPLFVIHQGTIKRTF